MNTCTLNGVDTDQVKSLAKNIKEVEHFGDFQFRVRNDWITGSMNKTSIDAFYAGGEDRTAQRKVIAVNTDQPEFLAGNDTSPNPVEYYLHALASCLTTTLVYHASVLAIPVEQVEILASGYLNAQGFFGVSDQVNKGFERVKVKIQVTSDASEEVLKKLAMYSPVYEMVSKAVPVEFTLEVF